LNTDLSVAPEIAQLADPFVPAQPVTAVPRTDGRTAAALTELAATPQRWWDLVRFDAGGPVRIPVPGDPGAGPGEPAAWLLVLPPGASVDCDCQQATALAGEATEAPAALAPGQPSVAAAGPGRGPEPDGGHRAPGARPSPLRPGRVRVHGAGGRHRLHAAGPGYSVTLHVGASSSRSD
jgi:hypothetical protein